MMLKYLSLFFLASGFSLLLTPLVRRLAIKLGAMDQPDERKIHSQPIPRLGGFPIFITFNLILLLSSQFAFFHFPSDFLQGLRFGWLLVASAIVLGLGAVDDFKRMSPAIKFIFQIIAGLIVALIGYKIEQISSPFGTLSLGIWSIPATVFWVVAITNAINLLDGLDGLAAGTAFIVSLTMFGITVLQENIGIALVCIILAGSILGFLRYNFNPASIFLGDSGAYFLGFELSVLSLQSSLKGTTTVAILAPMLALGLPIMDTLLSMLRRLLNSLHLVGINGDKKEVKFIFMHGWSMFKADKDHIHHKLLQIGFTQRKAVVLLYAISIILGGLTLLSVYLTNINYALLITTIVLAAYIGVRKLGYGEIEVLRNGALLPLFDRPVVNRRILRVFIDIAFISFSYYAAFVLRFEKPFDTSMRQYYVTTLPLVLATKIGIFYLVGLYKGAWRYTNVGDLLRMVKGVLFGCIASAILLWIIPGYGITSRAALLIDLNLLIILVIGARSSFRILEHIHITKKNQGRKVLIYGVGREGINALSELNNNPNLGLSPVGFIDDDPRNEGKEVIGYPVFGPLDSLDSIIEKNPISEVIVAINNISEDRLNRLSKICNSCQISLRRFQTRLEEIST